MRAVILAAGDGGRLGRHTASLPKPLVAVAGRPLIEYTFDALAANGIDEAVVVTGYLAGQLERSLASLPRSLPRVSFVSNPNFTRGASYSLRAARQATAREPFLLLMADHLLSAAIIRQLLDAWRPGGPSLIATDAAAWPDDYAEEATRVRFLAGTRLVSAIGKGLQPFDALDTGAFLLGPRAWEAVDDSPEDCELSPIFAELAGRRQLLGVDVSGAPWYDVDTAADLAAANSMLTAGGSA